MTSTLARARVLTALVLGLAATLAGAQAWPTKPISLVVPFPPGGSSDVLARALGDKLGQSLGQPVIVESRPGAGATLGADYVAKAKPSGLASASAERPDGGFRPAPVTRSLLFSCLFWSSAPALPCL